MSHSHPPLPDLNLRTTPQIIRQALSTCFASPSSFFTFLSISLLLLSFRAIVENGSLFVTSVIDRDSGLKALLSSLDVPGRNLGSRADLSPTEAAADRRGHRRPFLHLTRVGTLDDDFFSSDDEDDRTLFGFNGKPSVNGSFVKLRLTDFMGDSGVRVSDIVRPEVSLKFDDPSSISDNEDEYVAKENDEAIGLEDEGDRVFDLQFFVKGLELNRRNAAALFFVVSFLSAAYGWVILGFLLTYSWVLGIVFVGVVNDLLGRHSSCLGNIWVGSRLGIRKLSGFILLRWAVRDAVTQLLGLWFFSEIEDQYSFFRLFVRLKMLPFSVLFPWVRGFEREVAAFLVAWFVVDNCLDFVFAVDSWVTIVDPNPRRTGREIVKEGCRLLSRMMHQAIQIKALEAIFCGSFVRWALGKACGKVPAAMFQSVVEVYFMITWLVFYLATRYKDAAAEGRSFGQRELEALVEGVG